MSTSNLAIDTNNHYAKVTLGLRAKALLERGIDTDRQQVMEVSALVENHPLYNPQQAADILHEVDATKANGMSLANKILMDLKYDYLTLAMYGALTPDLYPKREWIGNAEGAPIATQVPWDPARTGIPSFATRAEAITYAHSLHAQWVAANPGKPNPAAFNGAL